VEAIDHHEMMVDYSKKSYLFECYYCDKFSPTTNEQNYLKHVVLNHENKPAYPSLSDLKKIILNF
jgi:hypothetical protein